MDDSQGRLLIVEDDSALRRSLRTTLDVLGFDVGEASNGEDGLVRLRMVDYEAVLLDINMPGIGGIETCRRIRRIHTKMPILMLTVRDSEDDKVEALEAGADDYVTKPFQTRELTARIRAAVRRFRAAEDAAGGIHRVGVAARSSGAPAAAGLCGLGCAADRVRRSRWKDAQRSAKRHRRAHVGRAQHHAHRASDFARAAVVRRTLARYASGRAAGR